MREADGAKVNRRPASSESRDDYSTSSEGSSDYGDTRQEVRTEGVQAKVTADCPA
jgi:hypothetical protein